VADPRGFLTTQRETPKRRPVDVRIKDWSEVYEEQPFGDLQKQAGRCMDCGIPFCHQGCPLGNLIPEWNDLIWRGERGEAIDRLHATNNFPEFTGRLCPAPCETACVVGINSDAVTIKQVELRTIEEAFNNGLVVPLPPDRLTGKTVAVVGSGPAGLAAAQQLTRAGHTVAVTSAQIALVDCCGTEFQNSKWRNQLLIDGSNRCPAKVLAFEQALTLELISQALNCAISMMRLCSQSAQLTGVT